VKLNNDNVKIFESSVGNAIDELYETIYSNKIDFLSLDNFAQDMKLNSAGFQVYRTLLYDQIFEQQRRQSSLFNSELHQQMMDNGFIEINNFFDKDVFSKIEKHYFQSKRKFNTRNGSFNFPIKFNVASKVKLKEVVKLCQADQEQNLEELYMRQIAHCNPSEQSEDSRQYRFHYDKFYPNYKIWFYVEEMTLDLGPTACFVGSHKNSIAKMKWFHHSSLNVTTEWSRASLSTTNYLEQVEERTGFSDERILTGKPNTFFIIDTRMLHRRTPTVSGKKRFSLRAILPRIKKNEI